MIGFQDNTTKLETLFYTDADAAVVVSLPKKRFGDFALFLLSTFVRSFPKIVKICKNILFYL